jgi:Na+-transporting NADH:ubiquinone oxidoreductase subunit C
MSEQESLGKTVFVAASVALVCSLIVSVAVTWLRPIQLAYRSVEQNRAVLIAAGLAAPEAVLEDRDVVSLFLELDPQLVDLDAGRFVGADASMIASYDFRAAAEDPAASREIAAAADIASIGRRPLLMPVYVQRSGGKLEQLVLPVYGRGMWSTIYGYVVLNADLSTIARAWFYEHGETPGIGDRIQNPEWLARWIGKRAFAEDGTMVLRIGTAGTASADERIDGITGATVTVGSVDRLVRYWLGDDGFDPFLVALRKEL